MRFTISDISTALVFLSPEPKKRDNNTHDRNEQSGKVMMTEMKSTSLQLQLIYYKKKKTYSEIVYVAIHLEPADEMCQQV